MPRKFNINTQHDALEFYDSILDSLRYEFELINQLEIFEKYFGFELETKRTCQNCFFIRSETLNHFSLLLNMIDETCTLNVLLENFFEEKYVPDFKCTCGNFGLLEATSFRNLPKFLNIKISRFTNQLTKIMAYLKYEENIIIMDMPYALTGVLIHQGNSIQCGHYYSYLNLERRWFKVNDSVIEETSFKKLIESEEATCMLVYEQISRY